jgi:hypothetical protein
MAFGKTGQLDVGGKVDSDETVARGFVYSEMLYMEEDWESYNSVQCGGTIPAGT